MQRKFTYLTSGTRIQRIIESYENSLLTPVFRPAPASFIVTLPQVNHKASALYNGNISREELVLTALREKGVITRKEVEQLLGQSKFTAIKVINSLLANGKIVKTGSAKAVRYRLLN